MLLLVSGTKRVVQLSANSTSMSKPAASILLRREPTQLPSTAPRLAKALLRSLYECRGIHALGDSVIHPRAGIKQDLRNICHASGVRFPENCFRLGCLRGSRPAVLPTIEGSHHWLPPCDQKRLNDIDCQMHFSQAAQFTSARSSSKRLTIGKCPSSTSARFLISLESAKKKEGRPGPAAQQTRKLRS